MPPASKLKVDAPEDRLPRNIEQLASISASDSVTAAVFQDRGIKRRRRVKGGARYAGNGTRESGENRARKMPSRGLRNWENIDAAFTWRIFLGNPASVANERESRRASKGGAQGWDSGGNGRWKRGTRYRQLAGSYIELRSGAYLSTSPSNLSPRLSPAFSSVHLRPPFSRYPLRILHRTSDNAFSKYTDNSHWCHTAARTFWLIHLHLIMLKIK